MDIQLMEFYRELKDYTYDKISELSGIPIETVQKIFKGEIRPDSETAEALEQVLGPESYLVNNQEEYLKTSDSMVYQTEHPKESVSMVCEARTAYRAEKRLYTLEDYYALPDDQRAELIDGAFYNMSSPTSGHQIVLGRCMMQIANFIDRKKGQCVPFVAPMDVQLDCDDRTMVEPDIFIVCDRNKITRKCIVGAPDFIIEVLSESTKRKDMYLKLHKYEAAGVREYWMADIEKRKVIVYFFEKEDFPTVYSMEDKIPVGIYDGELLIDFADITEELIKVGQ